MEETQEGKALKTFKRALMQCEKCSSFHTTIITIRIGKRTYPYLKCCKCGSIFLIK